jgi:glucokinase
LTVDDIWAVGLDVGGTKIAAGLSRFPAGVVTHRRRIPTQAERGPQAVLADAVKLAGELAALVPSGERFVGVGLGVPELVDPNGQITSSFLMPITIRPRISLRPLPSACRLELKGRSPRPG